MISKYLIFIQSFNYLLLLYFITHQKKNKQHQSMNRLIYQSNWLVFNICTQGMAQQYSSINQQIKKQQSQHLEEQVSKKQRQVPFYKNSTIAFVKVGLCHMCKMRNKVVYQCHKNYCATSCQKKFCLDCLVLIYKQNIIQKLQKQQSWKCPYIKKVCRCKNCCQSRKQTYSLMEIDPNMSVYSNLRLRNKLTGGSVQSNQIEQVMDLEDENQIDQSMRCLIRQRFKRLIDFNGQLINKVNVNYHKLTEDEIKFYNKLIHSNLKVLNNIANNMVAKQTLIQE